MSPVGSTAVGPYTVTPSACALTSGAVSVRPVPLAPPVPTVATTALSAFDSASMVIAIPTAKPETLWTLMFVAPTAAAVDNVVGPAANATEVLFSRTTFASAVAPNSQPARVYGTHGAGAFMGDPESPVTML